MSPIPWLSPQVVAFPHPEQAMSDPDGLLAAGGDLSTEWLVEAYSHGIFPWFDDDDDHILWWSPATRAVLQPGHMKVSRSLSKRIRNGGFSIRWDQDFAAVIQACRGPRRDSAGTWITPRMQAAYTRLHHQGLAHCVAAFRDGAMVGGLYGVSLGRMFFGESMFSHVSDASKVAFFHLQEQLQAWNFQLIDCQMENPHLMRLGVTRMPRNRFLQLLTQNRAFPTHSGNWGQRLPQSR